MPYNNDKNPINRVFASMLKDVIITQSKAILSVCQGGEYSPNF
jgi:hypothetical protein